MNLLNSLKLLGYLPEPFKGMLHFKRFDIGFN